MSTPHRHTRIYTYLHALYFWTFNVKRKCLGAYQFIITLYLHCSHFTKSLSGSEKVWKKNVWIESREIVDLPFFYVWKKKYFAATKLTLILVLFHFMVFKWTKNHFSYMRSNTIWDIRIHIYVIIFSVDFLTLRIQNLHKTHSTGFFLCVCVNNIKFLC